MAQMNCTNLDMNFSLFWQKLSSLNMVISSQTRTALWNGVRGIHLKYPHMAQTLETFKIQHERKKYDDIFFSYIQQQKAATLPYTVQTHVSPRCYRA